MRLLIDLAIGHPLLLEEIVENLHTNVLHDCQLSQLSLDTFVVFPSSLGSLCKVVAFTLTNKVKCHSKKEVWKLL